jgi:hypothetical protein
MPNSQAVDGRGMLIWDLYISGIWTTNVFGRDSAEAFLDGEIFLGRLQNVTIEPWWVGKQYNSPSC